MSTNDKGVDKNEEDLFHGLDIVLIGLIDWFERLMPASCEACGHC